MGVNALSPSMLDGVRVLLRKKAFAAELLAEFRVLCGSISGAHRMHLGPLRSTTAWNQLGRRLVGTWLGLCGRLAVVSAATGYEARLPPLRRC